MAAKKETDTRKNLIPITERAKDVQRQIRSSGGKARAEKVRERKLVSQIYSDFLASEFEIEIGEEKKKFTGHKLLSETIKKVLIRGDSSSVSMAKEIREATEGNKIELSGQVTIIDDVK